MIIWVITHFVHRSTYNKRVNISAFGSIRHRLQKQQIRRNWNHKDPNLVEEMYTTCPLICWCSSMFSLLWCKILLLYNEYSPFRRSNFYHTWNISYRTISTPSFLVKIGTCLGLNSLVLTVKTHQPCFRLFARGVFLSVISSASLPFFCRHPAILDFCGGYRWQLVPRLPFPVPPLPAPPSPLPVPRFSNIHLRCHALLTALHLPLETIWSCKKDRKERYWGQLFWQMERDISVRPIEMTRPVTVDHLQS